MKKFIKFFSLVAVLALCVGFASCSKDDDDEPKIGNIVGTWISTEVETEGAVTWTKTYTLNFKSNGTGYRQTENKASTGATSSDMYTFRYTVATQSDGTLTITLVDDEDQYTQQWKATQTGNTLMVGSRIYKRK